MTVVNAVIYRLSSIDTKYHIWKMGVVLTDNVSIDSENHEHQGVFDTNILCFYVQSFLYLIWYTTMSILGHYNNFFFAAHLLDIAMGFKTLRTILSSVTHNGKQACVIHQRATVVQFYPNALWHFILILSLNSWCWLWDSWQWWSICTPWWLSTSSASSTTRARMRTSLTWSAMTWWLWVVFLKCFEGYSV